VDTFTLSELLLELLALDSLLVEMFTLVWPESSVKVFVTFPLAGSGMSLPSTFTCAETLPLLLVSDV
jgi:hypothetical protein